MYEWIVRLEGTRGKIMYTKMDGWMDGWMVWKV